MEHLQRLAQRLLDVAEAVGRGEVPPSRLVQTAHVSAAALDNQYPDWKRHVRDLSLDVDVASNPWPPHTAEAEQRRAVLAAAQPYLARLRALLLNE